MEPVDNNDSSITIKYSVKQPFIFMVEPCQTVKLSVLCSVFSAFCILCFMFSVFCVQGGKHVHASGGGE